MVLRTGSAPEDVMLLCGWLLIGIIWRESSLRVAFLRYKLSNLAWLFDCFFKGVVRLISFTVFNELRVISSSFASDFLFKSTVIVR